MSEKRMSFYTKMMSESDGQTTDAYERIKKWFEVMGRLDYTVPRSSTSHPFSFTNTRSRATAPTSPPS
jgi:hypothetical protein